jgi:hypothetical protein
MMSFAKQRRSRPAVIIPSPAANLSLRICSQQQKILLNFLNQLACDYFGCRSLQAKAFKNLKKSIKLCWETEKTCKKEVECAVHCRAFLALPVNYLATG